MPSTDGYVQESVNTPTSKMKLLEPPTHSHKPTHHTVAQNTQSHTHACISKLGK